MRVTAKAKARASAASPASWAPTTGAPSGRADVSATGRVRALGTDWLALPVDFGLSVGNRPDALPPGLSVGIAAGMPGRLPTGSGEVTITGTGGTPVGFCPAVAVAVAAGGGAVTETVADAFGFFAR